MIVPAFFVERHKFVLLLMTSLWTGSGVITYLLAPLAAPAMLLLAVVAPVGWWLMTRPGLPLRSPSPVIVGLVVAAGYLGINSSWSLSPSSAQFAIIMLSLFTATLYLTRHTLLEGNAETNRAMATALYAGMVIGGAVIFIEVFSEQWIRRQLMSIWPALRPDNKHIALVDGPSIHLQPYLLNRSTAALTLLLWPTAHAVVLLAPDQRRRLWLLAGLVPVVAAILGSMHETSKIAFVGAAAAFGFAQLRPAAVRRAILWAWVAVIVLVVPAATLAYQSGIYHASWLQRSAQHRIVIWGHTSQQIAKAPILGAGLHAARAHNDPHGYDAPLAPGSEFRLTTSLHSHNAYLQAWYETGAVGAFILLALGLLVLRSVGEAPVRAQPYLYATFVACALMGGSSFSLWQTWFMASLGLVAVFATLGWAMAGTSKQAAG